MKPVAIHASTEAKCQCRPRPSRWPPGTSSDIQRMFRTWAARSHAGKSISDMPTWKTSDARRLRLAAPELGLALAGEAGVELLEVLGGHEQRLREGFHLDRARVV